MSGYDPRAWIAWLVAGALLSILCRNPIYLLILVAVSRVTETACGSPSNPAGRLNFWRIAAVILIFSTLFNLLTAHAGQTVLATLPGSWWIIGGTLTAEAAAYGFISGLSLVAILSFFMAFNAIVPVSQITRLTPRALHELGLMLLVAVTYLPELSVQWRRIREAQAIRGHRVRSLTDWRPLALPLLVGGLERSMNLAETMVSRGFASAGPRRQGSQVQLAMLVGLVLLMVGVLALAWGRAEGWLGIGLGFVAVAAAYRLAGQRMAVTRYWPRSWTWSDTVLVFASAVPLLLAVVPLPFGGRATLSYSPYPALALPPFDPIFGASLLLLLVPALIEMAR